MTRYWIAVASLEHVRRGVEGGFAQVCHGKPGPLNLMKGGDWIIYYSPTNHFGGKDPCRSFTAIGRLTSEDPYTFASSKDFIPWRRNVNFIPSRETPIEPLLEALTFIKNKEKWGFPFRRGCFEISERDFQLLAKAMRRE
jgi:hypothetical protein